MVRTAAPSSVAAEATVEASPPSRWRAILPDLLIAAALFGWALVLRWNFHQDGLFYDDAWQALGPARASISQLFAVSEGQPGFGLVLMGWSRVFGDGSTSMVTPALIAGALGPATIFLGLRWFRYPRTIAALLGTILCIVETHISFSTHVKSYTADILLVMLSAVVVSIAVRWDWDVRTGIAWFLGATLVASFSAVSPLIAVAAGFIVVLHPRGDLRVRIIAVGAQLVALSAYLLAVMGTFNVDEVNKYWRDHDGFIGFTANPLSLGHDVLEHLVQVAMVFTNAERGLAIVVLVVAVTGLVGAAWRGPRVIPARFLGLMTLAAIGGSVIERVPFGAEYVWGGRISLWLAPVLAFGLAASLDFVRRRVGVGNWSRVALDAGVVVVAAVIVLSAVDESRFHRFPGARLATRTVMSELRPRDRVWLTRMTTYSFALSAETPVGVKATPHREVGYLPDFEDPRFVPLEWDLPEDELRDSVEHATRVYVVNASTPSSPFVVEYRFKIAALLLKFGFTPKKFQTIATASVDVWVRGSTSG
jgi:hypothetical protein